MFDREVFENSLRLVMEEIPHVRSVSVGIWIGTGSRNETEEFSGISHFIEHMLFKGTSHRTAREIAEALDGVGGQIDAFTGRETTCYEVKVLDQHLPLGIEILADILLHSVFDRKEIEKEKQVVLEEIKMYEDSPDELIHDLFSRALWWSHPLGQPVLGSRKVIEGLTRQKIIDYLHQSYLPRRIVIAVAGNISFPEVKDLVRHYFGGWQSSSTTMDTGKIPEKEPVIVVEGRKLRQMYFCLGTYGLDSADVDRYTLYVLNAILGGGVSSRLFQEIREKRALVYDVYSYHSSYRDTGLFSVYAGTSIRNLFPVIDLIRQQFQELKEKEISDQELKNAKEQLKGNFMLSLESTGSRMGRLARSELYFGRLFTLDETLTSIDAVKKEDILRLASKIFQEDKLTIASLGKFSDRKQLEKFLGRISSH